MHTRTIQIHHQRLAMPVDHLGKGVGARHAPGCWGRVGAHAAVQAGVTCDERWQREVAGRAHIRCQGRRTQNKQHEINRSAPACPRQPPAHQGRQHLGGGTSHPSGRGTCGPNGPARHRASMPARAAVNVQAFNFAVKTDSNPKQKRTCRNIRASPVSGLTLRIGSPPLRSKNLVWPPSKSPFM
jgi:hypothetical protein